MDAVGAPRTAPAAPRPKGDGQSALDRKSSTGIVGAFRRRRTRQRAFGAEPPRRAPLFLGKLGYRVADAFVAIVALLFAEALIVGLMHAREFVSGAELLSGARLVPLAVVAAGPVAVIAGAWVEAVAQAEGQRARWIASVGAGVLVAAFLFALLTGNPHAEGVRRPGAAILGGLGAFALAWFGARYAAASLRTATAARRAIGVLAVAIAAATLVEALNTPSRTSAGRIALIGAACLAAACVSLARDPSAPRAPKTAFVAPAIALVLFATMAAIAAPAAQSLALSDNVRRVFTNGAPMLAGAVDLATEIAPPPARKVEPPAAVNAVNANTATIVLVTIDALRADHLGFYGYERAITPSLDQFAQGALVYEAAYTSTPNTTYGAASILTGKRIRPLVVQGFAGPEGFGDTWATLLGAYDFDSAAFTPPSLFATDPQVFVDAGVRPSGDPSVPPSEAQKSTFGFSRCSTSDDPIAAFSAALDQPREGGGPELFWVHIDGDAELRAHPGAPLGGREVDLYDERVSAIDSRVGQLLSHIQTARPDATIVLTALAGEELGDHGVHGHGDQTYEEQVRVPLLIRGPHIATARIKQPIETIDVLPSILSALDIPKPARIRGRDRSATFDGTDTDPGFVFAETATMTMIGEDAFRLVCFRKTSTCALYNARRDPSETRDVSGNHPEVAARLRADLADVEANEGRYESHGGKGAAALPDALRRGIAGDGDAALDVAALLNGSDVDVRRRAAEVLFDLARSEVVPAMKTAFQHEEDAQTKAYLAVGLTRLGQSVALATELLNGSDLKLRRLAALALAENGDKSGEDELIRWWRRAYPHDPLDPREPLSLGRAKEILLAFGRIKPRMAIVPLLETLREEPLRAAIARTIGDIGDEAGRLALANQLLVEHNPATRRELLDALLRIKAGAEIVEPLVAMLGIPDPIDRGIEAGIKTDMLRHIGGPQGDHDAARLRKFATSGVAIDFYVPHADIDEGVRVVCLARSDASDGEIRVGRRVGLNLGEDEKAPVPKHAPTIDPARSVTLSIGASRELIQVFATLPASADVHPGNAANLVIYATQKVTVDACALIPLRSTIPTGRRRTSD